ncbi:MAG TPA: hypothetical protein PKM43_17130, partial [Verrucomicrobiota bacterium]|nr:hypothetical protein [Verrucomicrobiota bacterium]
RVTNLLALLLALEGYEICNSLSKQCLELEAEVGIEPHTVVFRDKVAQLAPQLKRNRPLLARTAPVLGY